VKMKELKAQLQQNKKNITLQQQQLSMLLNTDTMYLPLTKPLEKLSYTVSMAEGQHPSLALQQQNINIANANISVQQNTNKPEFSGRLFSQRLYGAKDPYTGFSVTAAFPL